MGGVTPEAEGRFRTTKSGGAVAIDFGVQGGIVVHLQLAVELEAARASEGALPEVVEANGKVVALGFKNRQSLAVALGMACGGGFGLGAAGEFFAGVKDLKREDGEAVDDEAGGLGVERGIGVGETARGEFGEKGAVEIFGKVVAALVRCV